MANDSEALILDRVVERVSAERSLLALIERKPEIEEALGSMASRISLRWPVEIVVSYDGGFEGYVAPALNPAFVTTSGRSKMVVKTLLLALDEDEPGYEPVEQRDRFELVRLVATWLGALHAANVVHGGVSLERLAFASAPLRIAPLDYATSRVLGYCPWHDPILESSLDTDRREFAKVAFALLGPRVEDLEAWLRASAPVVIPGVDDRSSARLRWLWLRAVGREGTMPTLEEWISLLDPA